MNSAAMTVSQEHSEQQGQWQMICKLSDIAPDTGVCAWHKGEQVALFRIGNSEQVLAIGNFDPIGGANVLSRGIVGSVGDRLVVASPLYKQHYDLHTGECLEDATVQVNTWPVSIEQGNVLLG